MGNPGNRGGRPPNEVRRRALETYDRHLARIEKIITAPKAKPQQILDAMAELRQAAGLNRQMIEFNPMPAVVGPLDVVAEPVDG